MSDSSLTFFIGVIYTAIILVAIFYVYPKVKITIFDPPYLVTAMFLGYAGGMLYFPTHDLRFALFFSQVSLGSDRDVRGLLLYSSIFLIVAVTLYIIGVYQAAKNYQHLNYCDYSSCIYSYRSNKILASRHVSLISLIISLLGSLYFFYYSRLAGGFGAMVESFSFYAHLVKEIGITTLPFNLIYLGFFLCLAHLVACRLMRRRISIYSLSICFFSFVVSVFSFIVQARIYPIIGLFVVGLMSLSFPVNRPIRWSPSLKLLSLLASLPVLSIIFLVLRNENSQAINNLASQFVFSEISEFIDYILYQLIGRGNVVDIQQIAIIIKAWPVAESLLGLTFFDWLVNMFNRSEPISVGIRTMQTFFPGSSGAPTPGIIGEFYSNFNFLSLPLVWLYGYLSAAFSFRFWPRASAARIVSYSIIITFFFLIVTKVDTSLIDNLLFWLVPYWISVITLSMLAYFFPSYRRASLDRSS